MMKSRVTMVAALLIFLGVSFFGVSVARPVFAQARIICHGTSTCTSAEIGPFMSGVSVQCGNTGTCSLCDIEITLIDIGEWILGIAGVLVLFFYVWGGFTMLISGGASDRVKQGKSMLTTATIGLVIIFVAYAAVFTLARYLLGTNLNGSISVNVTGTPTANGLTTCTQGGVPTVTNKTNTVPVPNP